MEEFEFFWNGPFSQWLRCRFVVDGVKYNCAEQYMMAEKARLFGDKKMERAIMKSTSPREQKAFGRKVKNFNVHKWESVARDIVYKGNYAKFTQDKKLLKVLLLTKGTTIVEASPYDKIWGIGLRKDDKRAQSRSTWQGKNWLGEVLTKLRDDLLKEEEALERQAKE